MDDVEPFVVFGCDKVAAELVEVRFADLVFVIPACIPGGQPFAAKGVRRPEEMQLMVAFRFFDQLAHPGPDGGRVGLEVEGNRRAAAEQFDDVRSNCSPKPI